VSIPFVGIFHVWASYFFYRPFIPDYTRTYAHGVMADIQMARNNSRCASNIYVKFGENLKPDY
jgi:hypothetical protein